VTPDSDTCHALTNDGWLQLQVALVGWDDGTATCNLRWRGRGQGTATTVGQHSSSKHVLPDRGLDVVKLGENKP
jgi:hypothetical protein